MKKSLLLSFCLMLSYSYIQAQIVVAGVSPAAVAGNKGFSWANPADGWGTADLNIPANSIIDTLMRVHDGTAFDSCGCQPLINDLTGKIAVVYRGPAPPGTPCEFGVKAKNAQDAGAVGVIIVNHSGSAVGFTMGAGGQGLNVTIPTVMISTDDGGALLAEVDAGSDVVVFIGNKFGKYPNDLGLYTIDALTSRVSANPALISASAAEFNVPMGAWIHNYGTAAQNLVTLTGVISGAASYTATSAPIVNLPALGDSAYVTIPTYVAASYSGFYEVNYTINYGNTDSFPSDNSFYSNFLIDSLFSYTYFDAVTKMPKNGRTVGPATPPTELRSCIHFMDANASRLSAMGLYAAVGSNITIDITGETIDGVVYSWNDVFTGLSDPAFPATWNLTELGSASYTYLSNDRGKMVYIPFPSKVDLMDNQRYLFCQRTYNSAVVELGFDSHYNYTEAQDTANGGHVGHDQPVSVLISDADYFSQGYGNEYVSSVTPKFQPAGLSVNEHNNSFDVTPYPNPTTEFIKIPLKGRNGTAQLKIMDLNGKVVSAQTVKVAGDVAVNVTGIPTGNYVFNMLFEDGHSSTFKVVITK